MRSAPPDNRGLDGGRAEFVYLVRRLFAPTIKPRGFREIAHQITDKMYQCFIFRSDRMKLYLYRSVRDGEVNALVARPDLRDRSGKPDKGWIYIRKALHYGRPLPSLDDLAKTVPRGFPTTHEQLTGLLEVLDANFEVISQMILDQALEGPHGV